MLSRVDTTRPWRTGLFTCCDRARAPPFRASAFLSRRISQPELPGTLGCEQIGLLNCQPVGDAEQLLHALSQFRYSRGSRLRAVRHEPQQPFAARAFTQLIVGDAR